MRTALPLVVLIVLARCDAAASKPKRAASTGKAQPPASLPMPSRPEPPAASVWRVVSVHGGDTLRAIDEGKTEQRIRLAGIAAPERLQPFGNVAREGLAALTKGKAVAVHVEDRGGRTLIPAGDESALRVPMWIGYALDFGNRPLI